MHQRPIPVSANFGGQGRSTLGPRGVGAEAGPWLWPQTCWEEKQEAAGVTAEAAWISLLLSENKDGRGRHVQIKRPQRREGTRTRFSETQRSRKTIPGTRNKILTIRFCQCDTMWHQHISYNLMEGDYWTCVKKYIRANVFMSGLLFLDLWHFLSKKKIGILKYPVFKIMFEGFFLVLAFQFLSFWFWFIFREEVEN